MRSLPSIDMRATGNNIVQMRQRMGMTVQDLQRIFGFSTPQAIYKWQRGTAMPTLDKEEADYIGEKINEIVP